MGVKTDDKPVFGGKTVIFGGDFRQVLPVIARGDRAAIVNMCMKFWSQWPKITTLCLTQNERIRRKASSPEEAKEFGDYLMRYATP
jgi:ATP-dependent DNA helicase PIF1